MNTIRKILLIEMGASLSIVLAIVLLYECGILAMGNSMIDGQTMFLVMVIMQLITIACIPLALYLFRISKVQRQLTVGDDTSTKALLCWGTVRMMMICVPMIANTLLYYISHRNVSFAYMAIILALCLVMVYPSEDRCLYETKQKEQQ